MNCRIRLTLAATAAFTLISCRGDTVSPPIDGPMFAVSDGAHDGNTAFFFLPPLFKMPTVHPGTFNPDLQPSVVVCDLGIRPAQMPPPPRTCIDETEFSVGPVTVSASAEMYQVNWHTDQTQLLLDHDYRIRVLIGGAELGFADVDPVANMSQFKNVQTGDYIGLVDGRTLPIKFRIEDGALCGTATTPCNAGTIDLATGGNVELVVTENGVVQEVFEVTVEEGTTASFGGKPVTDVTFNVEECAGGGVDLDLRPFGRCVQITTFFEASSGEGPAELLLANPGVEFPLVVSTCRLESSDDLAGLTEEEEALITLHQQDGPTVRALSHVHPHCDVITRLNAPPTNFVRRGLQQLGNLAARLFSPEVLHAGTRRAVINLGAGGGTRVTGTDCTGSTSATSRFIALAECSAGAASAPLGIAAELLGASKTVTKFQFFQPAIMSIQEGTTGLSGLPGEAVAQPPAVRVVDGENPGVAVAGAVVTFDVVSGGGNFGAENDVPITTLRVATNSDGIATVPTWILGTNPEQPNIVRARGRGLAASPADTKPFVPDIHGANDAVELPTPTDAHALTFTATLLVGEGAWARTGDLPAPRRDHSATLLDDGDVLIVGGLGSGALIYNADGGNFLATEGAPLFEHRQGATATKLRDGRVLIVGGTGAPFRAEIYDPTRGSFTTTAGGPTEGATNASRQYHTATLLQDGRVLLAGGQIEVTCDPGVPCGPQSIADAEIYDPESDSFTPTGSLNGDRAAAAATLLPDGRVLVAGGSQTTDPGFAVALTSAEVYDPETGEFALTGSLPVANASSFTGITLLENGLVLVAGGISSSTTAALYDPSSGTFRATGSMASPHSAGQATLLRDGRVLISGGFVEGGCPITLSGSEIYNPATEAFTPAAAMVTGRLQFTATLLNDGRVLAVGGFSNVGGECSDIRAAETFSLPVIP